MKMIVSYGKPTRFDDVGCDGMYVESIEKTDKVTKLEEALTEQLNKQGYAFRGKCDAVPEDIERAFNALGICTEEHKTILEDE